MFYVFLYIEIYIYILYNFSPLKNSVKISWAISCQQCN